LSRLTVYTTCRDVTLDETMGNYVRNCTQTWVRVSKFAHAHDHVSQKVA